MKLLADPSLEGTSTHINEIIERMLTIVNPEIKPASLVQPKDRVLESFIEMVEGQPFNIYLGTSFLIDSSEALLENDCDLPLLYFGMQNLFSRLKIEEGKFETTYRSIFDSLAILLAKMISDTPVDFLGNGQIPTFKFSPLLVLDNESVQSIMNEIAKKIHTLMEKFILVAMKSEPYALSFEVPLPQNSVDFARSLQSLATSESEEQFYSAVNLLRTFLKQEPFPYPVDTNLLEWAKFCVFSYDPPSFISSVMDDDILETYYPSNFDETIFREKIQKVKKNGFLSKQASEKVIRLAVRDTFLAIHSREVTASPNCLYSSYQYSKRLFCFQVGESLKDWGERINKAFNNEPILEAFHQFWLEHYHATLRKNRRTPLIQMKGQLKKLERDWTEGISLEIWKKMIKENRPEKYPHFKELNQDEQKTLKVLIQKKHLYREELKKITKLSHKLDSVPLDDFLFVLASSIIVNGEYSCESSRDVFVQNEEQARKLQQILQIVTFDRVIRRMVVMEEFEPNIGRLPAILVNNLHFLHGLFHGPEEHIEDNGPLHRHYHAAVYNSNLAIVNLRIYFNA